MARHLFVLAAAAIAAASGPVRPAAAKPSGLLYAWSGDEDGKDSDFLAVIDVDPASRSYGALVGTTPTGVRGSGPHHIEYETPPGATLFANGWGGAQSFVFDLSQPRQPKIAARFARAGRFSHPHSFARLPGGHVVATFQSIGGKYAPPGGLVELDNRGRLVRGSGSATPAIPTAINWPYSLAVAPRLGRIVTTSTDMGLGKDWKSPETRHVQIWSLDRLRLLHSVALPDSGLGKHHIYPAEPRLLGDGSVLVNTFSCGLYKLDGVGGGRPSARFVHAFPSGPGEHDMCAVPVVIGKYWIQTVGAINGLVVLDVSRPDKPVEVSRLTLPHRFHGPHWVSADRASGRIAVTGMRDSWLAMLRLDASGRLSLDERFGEGGGIALDRPRWPHGGAGKAIVHGVVFGRP